MRLYANEFVCSESTIISHGMPYPQNIAVAKEVEAVCRQAGAVPATVAVINGFPKVGLHDADFELLGRAEQNKVMLVCLSCCGVARR